jgi:hypothetical protein
MLSEKKLLAMDPEAATSANSDIEAIRHACAPFCMLQTTSARNLSSRRQTAMLVAMTTYGSSGARIQTPKFEWPAVKLTSKEDAEAMRVVGRRDSAETLLGHC